MLKKSLFLVLSLAFFATGCARGTRGQTYPDTPKMNQKRYNNLLKMASAELSCDEAQLQHRFVGSELSNRLTIEVHEISGCGQQREYSMLCGRSCDWFQPARRQIGFELSCAPEELRFTLFSATAFGVEGCGKRANYTRTVLYNYVSPWVQTSRSDGETTPTQALPESSGQI